MWLKSTFRAKIKADSQEERPQNWKEDFKNLLGNSPDIIDISSEKLINCQLQIKLGQFTKKIFSEVLKKIKIRKAEDFDEIPPEECKTRKFNI